MRHLTVRNVSPALARAIEKERKRSGKSLNQMVLEILEQSLGVSRSGANPGNGLRKLAGTWSQEELDEFEKATAAFETIDEELWR